MRDLELLIRSRHPLIFLETEEKDRAQGLLLHLADRMKLPFFTWTRTKGLRPKEQLAADKASLASAEALKKVEDTYRPAIINFQGLGDDLGNGMVATRLRDAARHYQSLAGSIVVTGMVPELPNVIRPMSTVVELPLPTAGEFETLVEHLYRDLGERHAIEMHLTRGDLEQLVGNLSGFTLLEAEKVLTKAMIEDGRLGPRRYPRGDRRQTGHPRARGPARVLSGRGEFRGRGGPDGVAISR